jgi:phage tail-like protein
MAVGGHRIDPLGVNSFWLEFGNQKVATFQEISGLEDETEVRELSQSGKDGREVGIKTQGAAALKTGKITAKYAALKNDPVWTWRQEVVMGQIEKARRHISIVLYTIGDIEAMRFNFLNCWPSKYAFSTLSAKSNETLTVTVTIEHEGKVVPGYNS